MKKKKGQGRRASRGSEGFDALISFTHVLAGVEPLPGPSSGVHEPGGEDKDRKHAQGDKRLPNVNDIGSHLDKVRG